MIALLVSIAEAAEGGKPPLPHIVVAPASTLDNWERELRAWAPSLRALKFHGPQAARAAMRDDADATGGFDVLLTTYSYFEGDGAANKLDRSWMRGRPWGLMVLDEAHALKSASSARFQRLSGLRTRQRLLLTGTPVRSPGGPPLSLSHMTATRPPRDRRVRQPRGRDVTATRPPRDRRVRVTAT